MAAINADLTTPRGRYAVMVAVRELEERIGRLFSEGQVRGTAHLSVGQEACAVGAVAASRPDDPIVSSHRGHGHFLARTRDPYLLFAEMLGRADGACAGRGGSQHLCSARHYFYGTNGITGGGIPVATGLALRAKLQDTGQVVLCFFGDGATNQGAFHESVNMAALWHLPILYVCENNRYAMSTRVEDSMRVAAIRERAAAYGMRDLRVDGMDVEAVYDATRAVLNSIRHGDGPLLMEAECYRFCGHSKSDRLVYRTREEEALWRERDPLPSSRAGLLEAGIAEADLQALERAAMDAVAGACERAESAPVPTADQVLTSPYAEPPGQ